MQIEQRSEGELLELTVNGPLDNEGARHFRTIVDDHVRDGWHRILIHMERVNYISSAGIGALIATKKRLEQLKGIFGICRPTSEVQRVLSQMRLLDRLLCDPTQVRTAVSAGEYTRSLDVRIARASGLDLQVYRLDRGHSSRCDVLGEPQPVFESTFTEHECRAVEFSNQSIALGLGALGDDFASTCPRFGEFLAVAGAVAQCAQSRRGLPDYSLSQGEFIPRVQVLYGIQCEGRFSQLIRFRPVEHGQQAAFSAVVAECLRQAQSTFAGLVILAESAGLLGVHLRRSPAADTAIDADRFGFPQVRDWLSFSPERIYARNLALIVGVVQTVGAGTSSTTLDALLRPIDADGQLSGHFHAAVFPYRPLKKRTLDLHMSVHGLFESGTILEVLHLLRDDRSIVGAGETELLDGACWVSPISDPVTEESNR